MYDTVDIPATHTEAAEEWRGKLVEAVAENDDEIMELYLEGQEPSVEQLYAAIRRITLASAGAEDYVTVTPVFCGTAFKNKGVQPLLDAVVRYLPSPLDIEAIEGHDVKDAEEVIKRQPSDERAVRRSGVQDRERPAPRQAHLRPGLLGPPGGRHCRC